jgi:predicted homoserine dehydrogenase-like protein
VAKQNLKAGTRLDGIGGFHCYGLIMAAEESTATGLLPIGLAGFARLTRDVAQDQPIACDSVVFDRENPVVELYRRQLALVTACV